MKFLQNCFLTTSFTKTPSGIYHDYLREFWCTAVVENPDAPKEANIRFSVKNGTKFLTLDYKTFVKATGLDYTKTFIALPSEKDVEVWVVPTPLTCLCQQSLWERVCPRTQSVMSQCPPLAVVLGPMIGL